MKTPRSSLPVSAAACLVLFSGCALFGSGNKDKSVAQWQQASKTTISEGTPEAEAELRKDLVRERERLQGVLETHLTRAELSDDVILGTATFNDSYEADTFENQIGLLKKFDVVPEMDTPQNRDRGKFYKPTSDESKARLAKLYKKKKLLDEIRVALANTSAVGMFLVAEQRDTIRLNWSTELYCLQFGAQIRAFEQQFETEASSETLEEMAQVMAIRDQTRGLMVTHVGLLAAFEGVAGGGQPSAVTQLARASKAHINAPAAVEVKQARAYIEALQENGFDLGASLEASMRDAVGDEDYERHYQRQLTRTIKAVEKAEAEQSLYEQVDDAARLSKRKELKEQANTVQQRLTERAEQLAGAKAKSVISNLPFGRQALAGLRAVKELRAGNPRGALEAAIEAAPAGPIKAGMQTAATIGFAAADGGKRRRGRR